ncbi:succinate dehydrogenase assembly factor 2, partial [Acinetobacter baumannii]
MDRETRLKRLGYRAWHRGTKEADLLIGGFFDAHAATWTDAEITL